MIPMWIRFIIISGFALFYDLIFIKSEIMKACMYVHIL